jgi:hypothetical protein
MEAVRADSLCSELARRLRAHGRTVLRVLPDGNCLFSAVALLIPGQSHASLRMAACHFLRCNWERVCDVIGLAPELPLSDYLCEMQKPGCWGDCYVLIAIASVLRVPIKVWHPFSIDVLKPTIFYTVHAPLAGDAKDGEEPFRVAVELGWDGAHHFDAAVDASQQARQAVTPPPQPQASSFDQTNRTAIHKVLPPVRLPMVAPQAETVCEGEELRQLPTSLHKLVTLGVQIRHWLVLLEPTPQNSQL